MKRLLLMFVAALALAVPSLAQTVTTITIANEDATPDGDAWAWSHDPFTFSVDMGDGTTSPTINATAHDLRVYAKGSLTIEATGCAMTKVVFKVSTQGQKRLAAITASEGTIATQAKGDTEVTWTGEATSNLTFTVGENSDFGLTAGAGSLCVDAIEITSQEGEVVNPKKLMGLPVGEIVDGESYYLYNVDFGTWLGDNKSNASEPRPWTSRAELGHHGRDIKFIAKDGGWQLDPKLGNNHSINAGNLYMDTGAGVTVWTISAIEGDDANAVTIKSGDMSLAANSEGKMRAENEVTDNHNKWLIISRAERLRQAKAAASEENPVDISGIVLGGTFPVACDHRNGAWQGEKGSNASGGDGFYHCNRVWELWGISNRNIYQDIKDLPNGKYIVKARAIYVSTGNDGQNQDRYNEYVADPAGNTKGVIYANDVTSPMHNVYEYASDERVNDRFTRDLGNGKWTMNGTNEFSTNMFEGKGEIEPIEVVVTNGNLRVGFKVEGANNAWMLINNIDLAYAGEVKVDPTPYINALQETIEEANAMLSGDYAALQIAVGEKFATVLQNAVNTLNDENAEVGDLETAKTELVDLMNLIKDMSPAVANVQKTYEICYAELQKKADKDFAAYLETVGEKYYVLETKNAAETLLRQMQNHRKLYAADKVDVTMFAGAEPAEGDFYLLNVGTGLFFNTEADWGTHIAVGNDGMLVHLIADGDNGQPIFKMNGNGFNGLNWTEEYWDKNGEHRFHFTPVEGKDKVYYLNVFDNHNWHFVYDVDDDECDGGRRYWNAVQKRDWNVADYANNLCAQWMLVTEAEYKAVVAAAKIDAPVSATMFINNPNFNYVEPNALGNRTRGWENPGDVQGDEGGRHWSVLEWFERDVDMKQTIENLPAGFYKVSVNGFFRDGSADNEASKAAAQDTLKQLASLYAKVGENTVSTLLPNVTSAAGLLPGYGDTKAALEGAFANWPWQARHFFESGLYSATTDIIEVKEGEALTIGLSMENDGTLGNWVVADNFRLEYLGAESGVPTQMFVRYHGKWDGLKMNEAEDSTPLERHFTFSDYFVNDVQQEGIFINFKNGGDWYCPAGGENVVVNAGEDEITEVVKLDHEVKGWVVQNQTGYMTVDVYYSITEGMKVVFSDNTLEAMKDVENLYVVGEQTTGWSRSSEVCQKLEKKEDGIYEGVVNIKRDNTVIDAIRLITRPDNGDDDNHIGQLNAPVQVMYGTHNLGTGSTGRMYLRRGEQKITVNFNEGTFTVDTVNFEPSYVYAVGTLVDATWQNTNTLYKLEETTPNVFQGTVKVAEDGDSRFSLFFERTADDWNTGRMGPDDESIKPEEGVATTNTIAIGADKAWRVPAGEWKVALDLNAGSFTYENPRANELRVKAGALVMQMESVSEQIMALYPAAAEDEEFMEGIYAPLSAEVYDSINAVIQNATYAELIEGYDTFNAQITAAEEKVNALLGQAKAAVENAAIAAEVKAAAAALVAKMETTSDAIMEAYPEIGENEEFMELYMALSAEVYDSIQQKIGYMTNAEIAAAKDSLMAAIAAAVEKIDALMDQAQAAVENAAVAAEVKAAVAALVAKMETTSDAIMEKYPEIGENEQFMAIYMALSAEVYDSIQQKISFMTNTEIAAKKDSLMEAIAVATAKVEALMSEADKIFFIVSASVDLKADKINVVVRNEEDTYYYAVIEKSIVDMWQGAGVTTNEQILQAYLNVFDVTKEDLKKGNTNAKISQLAQEDGDYVFVVGGVELDGEDLVVTSAATRIDFAYVAPVTFIATAGQNFGGNEGADKAFDGDENTKWCDNVNENSFALITASEAVRVWGYELTTANDNKQYDRRIKGLKLYATNDATVAADANSTEWVEIASEGPGVDMQHKEDFYTTRYYTNAEAPKAAYQYFKLQITDGGFIQFSEFNFLYETEEIPVRYKWVAGSNENSAKVTDLDVTTKWEGNNLSGNWFIVEAEDGEAHEIKSYAITTHDDGSWGDRAPKHWTIEASNDMENWETIDEVDSDPIQNVSYTTYEFNVNTTEKYRYIKMNLIEMKGTGWTQVGEFYVQATKSVPAPEVTFDIAAEVNMEDGGIDVTITPSDEEVTYSYAVFNNDVVEMLGNDTINSFNILVNSFNEVYTGVTEFNALGDYLEYLGVEEIAAGDKISILVAEVERDAENKNIVRTGELTIVTIDITTGITNVVPVNKDEMIFNLAGQRVAKAQRGVNIINGKKVLVK